MFQGKDMDPASNLLIFWHALSGDAPSWTAVGLAVLLFTSVALFDLSPFIGILIFAVACAILL